MSMQLIWLLQACSFAPKKLNPILSILICLYLPFLLLHYSFLQMFRVTSKEPASETTIKGLPTTNNKLSHRVILLKYILVVTLSRLPRSNQSKSELRIQILLFKTGQIRYSRLVHHNSPRRGRLGWPIYILRFLRKCLSHERDYLL